MEKLITLQDLQMEPDKHEILALNIQRSIETSIGQDKESMLQDLLLALRFSGYHLVHDDEITPMRMR
jgi:hypothetical protein